MKKFTLLSISILIAASCSSDDTTDPETNTSTSLKIKSTSSLVIEDGKEDQSMTIDYSYNDKGYLSNLKNRDLNVDILSLVYKGDQLIQQNSFTPVSTLFFGDLTETTVIDELFDRSQSITHTYNANGKEIKRKFVNNEGGNQSEYEYNYEHKQDTIILNEGSERKFRSIYKLNNGKLVKSLHQIKRDNSYTSVGRTIDHFNYNDKGDLLEFDRNFISSLTNDSDNLKGKVVYEYTDKKIIPDTSFENLILPFFFSANFYDRSTEHSNYFVSKISKYLIQSGVSKLNSEETFDYKFDENQNLIQRTKVSIAYNENLITRKITRIDNFLWE